jgi:hypothetical protein
VRDELARRLAAGAPVVWLLLECGDAARDDAAAAVVRSGVEGPGSGSSADGGGETASGRDAPPSMLRVSRTDAREAALAAMLLRSEADLDGLEGPMAFPVFGHGRVLYALVGSGISRENVDDAHRFLFGSCSCLAKAASRGMDLIMMEARPGCPKAAAGPDGAMTPELSAPVFPRPRDGRRVDVSITPARPPGGPFAGTLARSVMVVLAGVCAALAFGTLVLWRRSRAV